MIDMVHHEKKRHTNSEPSKQENHLTKSEWRKKFPCSPYPLPPPLHPSHHQPPPPSTNAMTYATIDTENVEKPRARSKSIQFETSTIRPCEFRVSRILQNSKVVSSNDYLMIISIYVLLTSQISKIGLRSDWCQIHDRNTNQNLSLQKNL